jgi:hypothetical protein
MLTSRVTFGTGGGGEGVAAAYWRMFIFLCLHNITFIGALFAHIIATALLDSCHTVISYDVSCVYGAVVVRM